VRSGAAAADELSEYLLRQSLDNASYGLFSGRKSADKTNDGFTTVHFSEIPRARLASTGKSINHLTSNMFCFISNIEITQ
jgi:hypothetical protein